LLAPRGRSWGRTSSSRRIGQNMAPGLRRAFLHPSCEGEDRRVQPALTSDREELLSQPFPALRGHWGASIRLPGRLRALSCCRWRPVSDPLNPRRRTGDHQGISLFLFFQRSPLRRSRIAESTPRRDPATLVAGHPSFASQLLRLLDVPTLWFHATSPAFSSSILSALLQRLTTLGFIVVSPDLLQLLRVGEHPDSRDVTLPFEAFPPPIAVVADDTLARSSCGEVHTSSPTVTPLCCIPALPGRPVCTQCFEARFRRHPARCRAGPWPSRSMRSRALRVHQPPYRLVVQSRGHSSHDDARLDREPRGLPPSSGPLRASRFQLARPVLPWAWAPPSLALRRAQEESVRQR